MSELSPSLRPDQEFTQYLEAIRQLGERMRDYESRAAAMMTEVVSNTARMQSQFLESRKRSLDELSSILQADILRITRLTRGSLAESRYVQEIFSRYQLEALATGDATVCFGPAYTVYRGRRLPRIPNGRLLLMSRITSVDGKPGILDSGSLVAEYDCPADAWFAGQGSWMDMPAAITMEIALQPCGFLSAYLQSPLVDPQTDWYFRNLDGNGKMLRQVSTAGNTISTRVRLLETVFGAGMILQKFAYESTVEGNIFFEGDASFGYFPMAALLNQPGLDGGAGKRPWKNTHATAQTSVLALEKCTPGLLDTGFSAVETAALGGDQSLGYIYARKPIHPEDWYFQNHFYQDPVMPGSLGVEALFTLVKMLVSTRYPFLQGIKPTLGYSSKMMQWKYRGQVLPGNREMEFEVHISQVNEQNGVFRVSADGSAWVDGTRIYDIKNLSLDYLTSWK